MQAHNGNQISIVRKTTSRTFHLPKGEHKKSGAEHTERTNFETYPTNLLKRPHNGEPTSISEPYNDPAELYSISKRHKTVDWPLRNDVNILPRNHVESSQTPARSPPSLAKRKGKKSLRPSKFKEGSLNDKPSKEPPPSYIGEEMAMEEYSNSQDSVEILTHKNCNGGNEPAKPSSMFRFGRAIASALNPVAMWQGINGILRDKDQFTSENRERAGGDREEIKMAYDALKEGGFQGMKSKNIHRSSIDAPQRVSEPKQESNRNSFRDSAIDMDQSQDSRLSQDTNTSGHLTVPSHRREKTSISPLSESGTGRRSFTQLHTPSFQDMKRMTSNIQLPSARRRSSATPVLPSMTLSGKHDAGAVEIGAGLRRVPSKKDIARYAKLNKRVSDLEAKLEAARQELKQSLLDAPPVPDLPSSVGRKQFMPGALGSLASERLLNQHATRGLVRKSEKLIDAPEKQHDLALVSRVSDVDAKPTSEAQPWLDVELENASKSSSGVTQPSRAKTSRRKSTRKPDLTAPTTEDSKKRSLPNLPGLTSYSSPNWAKEEEEEAAAAAAAEGIPPLPAPSLIFDLATIDKAELLAMRAIPDRHLPFGNTADHISYLRKLYPSLTDHQISEYLATLPPSNKGKINLTSVQHANRPASPFLGPPQTISPMRTRSRAKKRGISPPPPSLASAKKVKGDEVQGGGDESPMMGRKGVLAGERNGRMGDGEEKRMLRSKKQGTSKQGVEKKMLEAEKPLPDIQKEDFEWDEDVF